MIATARSPRAALTEDLAAHIAAAGLADPRGAA
jgi:hypothetical protein